MQGRLPVCSCQVATDSTDSCSTATACVARSACRWIDLEAVLREAGFYLSDVVRLNYYTTDVDTFIEDIAEFGGRLAAARYGPASTLLGVSRLVLPSQLVKPTCHGYTSGRPQRDHSERTGSTVVSNLGVVTDVDLRTGAWCLAWRVVLAARCSTPSRGRPRRIHADTDGAR